MGKITNEMVHQSYTTAKKVYQGILSRMDGKLEIAKLTGMGTGSAGDYITVFLAMMDGECYKRTINLYATEYYLEHIGTDYGREAQKKAAQAISKHVAYYKTIHGYLAKTDTLAQKYK